jgi:hypothetical protein
VAATQHIETTLVAVGGEEFRCHQYGLLLVQAVDSTHKAQEGRVGTGQIIIEAGDDVMPSGGLTAAEDDTDGDDLLGSGLMGGQGLLGGEGALSLEEVVHPIYLPDAKLGLEVGEEEGV